MSIIDFFLKSKSFNAEIKSCDNADIKSVSFKSDYDVELLFSSTGRISLENGIKELKNGQKSTLINIEGRENTKALVIELI